jgi:hypothetical protein
VLHEAGEEAVSSGSCWLWNFLLHDVTKGGGPRVRPLARDLRVAGAALIAALLLRALARVALARDERDLW